MLTSPLLVKRRKKKKKKKKKKNHAPRDTMISPHPYFPRLKGRRKRRPNPTQPNLMIPEKNAPSTLPVRTSGGDTAINQSRRA